MATQSSLAGYTAPRAWAWVALWVAWAFPSAAGATLMEAMSLDTLVEEAEIVALVKGRKSYAFFSDPVGTKILSQVSMDVLEVWKGSWSPQDQETLDVVTPGGQVDAMTQVTFGAARLPVDRLMVLFLVRAPSRTGEHEVVGLGQGAWHVDASDLPVGPGTRVSRDPLELVEPGGGAPRGTREPETLGQLREWVRERVHGPG